MEKLEKYKEEIDGYLVRIQELESQISEAEKGLLVAETEMKATEKRIEELEQKCLDVTGKPIKELDGIIDETMKAIKDIMDELNTEE